MKGAEVGEARFNGDGAGWIGVVLGLAGVASVLAFGGVTTIGFTPAQVAVLLLAAVVFWQRGFPPVSRLTGWVLGILVAVPLLQLIPLPRSVIAALSPARAALVDDLMALGISFPETMAMTVHSHETQQGLLKLTCYVLVFLLAFHLYRLQERASALVSVLVGVGIFEAAYGNIQYLTGWQYIFTYRKVLNVQEATGTYINVNHFAGLLEMVLPFLLAGIMLCSGRPGSSRRSPWVEFIISPLTARFLRDHVLLAVVCVALIFSKSRMGIIAAISGMLVVGTVAMLRTRRKSMLALLIFILALPITYSIWIGITPVIKRFEIIGRPLTYDVDRLPIWWDTIALIRENPLFGAGLGTYRWASRHYQSANLYYAYEHAHSDYLEFAADIGIPATVLLFGSLWVLVVRVARRAVEMEQSSDSIVAAGCAGAMAAILIHGITDFNLQIPANAYLFSWIAGTATALVLWPPKRPATEWRTNGEFPSELAGTAEHRGRGPG
ncbi:MAG: O-antigen ligase family protein [Acidobacteria bacterium]|nr:O-antigen ligase family protein [Acidobacteriota bacterium]